VNQTDLRSKVNSSQVPISAFVIVISFLLAFNTGMREIFVLNMRLAFSHFEIMTGFSTIFSEARVTKLRSTLEELQRKKNPEVLVTPEELAEFIGQDDEMPLIRSNYSHSSDSDGEENPINVVTVSRKPVKGEGRIGRNPNEDSTLWTNIRQRLGSPLDGLFGNRQLEKDSGDVEPGIGSGS